MTYSQNPIVVFEENRLFIRLCFSGMTGGSHLHSHGLCWKHQAKRNASLKGKRKWGWAKLKHVQKCNYLMLSYCLVKSCLYIYMYNFFSYSVVNQSISFAGSRQPGSWWVWARQSPRIKARRPQMAWSENHSNPSWSQPHHRPETLIKVKSLIWLQGQCE